MRMIRKIIPILGGIFTSASFTYTGTYTWVDDGSGNWRLKFLTSGTFTPYKSANIDIFLLGGGSGGRAGNNGTDRAGAGGGGGYTLTQLNYSMLAGTSYTITIGDGGNGDAAGVASQAFGYTANGGTLGASYLIGGSGGSGGGGSASGGGGTNGGNGSNGGDGAGGTGQGTTTREFAEVSGTLYAGGGGAGASQFSAGSQGIGGAGGGANGGDRGLVGGTASANTGGGGGGGGGSTSSVGAGGAGGSGIVVIRNKR